MRCWPFCLGGYWAQSKQRKRARLTPDPAIIRPPRLSPWPYTVSVAKLFRGSFIWVLWLDLQALSAVAVTPLAGSTRLDHDSSNAPATARLVYVIAHTDTLATRHGPQSGGYCAQPPLLKNYGKQTSPLSSGCTIHAQGVKSWGGSFTWREFCSWW